MSEFVAKWVAAAFLLGFAWSARGTERRRALGLVLASLALLAFETGVEESALEIGCAALLALEVRRLAPGESRRAGWIGVGITCAALLVFAVWPWLAAAARALS
ncbi:MAG TPA: hypothetical protein VIC59_10570 [Gemmatimonadota bacterium]